MGISAYEIMKKADRIFQMRTSLSISMMTITTSSGSKRSFKQWGMNMGSRSVSKFASGFIKGMTMLSLNDGDEIWVYFPSSGRTRRLASHAKNSSVAGSDFSYNDMSNTKYSIKYRAKKVSEKGDYFTLELYPKKPSTDQYSKLKIWIRKDNYVPKKILYFNKDKEKYKLLTIDKIKTINSIITPMHFTMKNLESGSETTMKIIKIRYTNRLLRIFFSSNGLSRSLENWKGVYTFFSE